MTSRRSRKPVWERWLQETRVKLATAVIIGVIGIGGAIGGVVDKSHSVPPSQPPGISLTLPQRPPNDHHETIEVTWDSQGNISEEHIRFGP
jgi:hypothetical protein